MTEQPRRRPGAPKGNLNALKHGLTSRQFARVGALLAADPTVREALLEIGRRNQLKQRRAQEIAAVLFTHLMDHAARTAGGDLNLDLSSHDFNSIRRAAARIDPSVSAEPLGKNASPKINSRLDATTPNQSSP